MRRIVLLLAVGVAGLACDDGGGDVQDALVSPPSGDPDAAAGGASGQGGGGGEGGVAGQGGGGGLGGAGGQGGEGGAGGASCTPSRADWDAKIAGHVDTYCSQCHAAVPQFGATVTLTDYDGLIAGREGDRLVDRMAFRLLNQSMPPRVQPQPMPQETTAMVAWATCVEEPEAPRPPNPGGFDSTAEPLTAPAEPPAGAEFFDLLAPGYRVPRSDDHYECFNFAAPTDSERFIRRIDAVLDDSRVVHHLVLMRGGVGPVGTSDSCFILDKEIYAWAPGMGPLQFPDGGLRMQPGERFFIQIHYNNRANFDTRDSSGVRIYHAPAEGPEVGLTTLGPTQFTIPAGDRGFAEGHCVVPAATTVIGSWPHMHEIGYAFTSYVIKQDGSRHDLVTLSGWDFESQFVYATPMDLEVGDRIVTRCEWRNTLDRTVNFGPNTADEMCFNFLYHSPPLPIQACNQPPPIEAGEAYAGGACLEAPVEGVPVFRGRLVEGAPPALNGGEAEDGTYFIEGAEVYLPFFSTPVGSIDPVASFAQGRGVVVLDGDQLTVDFAADVNATLEDGRSVDLPVDRSFSGPIAVTGDGAINVTGECGGEDQALRYEVGADETLLSFEQNLGGFITLTVVMHLRRVE